MSTYLDRSALRQTSAVQERRRRQQQLLLPLHLQQQSHLVSFLKNTTLNNIILTVNQTLIPDAVLITGSINYPDTAELYLTSSNVSCSLPQLPDIRMDHTLESSGLMCGGDYTRDICLQWSPDTGSWTEELHLDTERAYHVSWTPDNGIGTYLMGGQVGGWTTTLVKPDGTQEQGFPLQYDTR